MHYVGGSASRKDNADFRRFGKHQFESVPKPIAKRIADNHNSLRGGRLHLAWRRWLDGLVDLRSPIKRIVRLVGIVRIRRSAVAPKRGIGIVRIRWSAVAPKLNRLGARPLIESRATTGELRPRRCGERQARYHDRKRACKPPAICRHQRTSASFARLIRLCGLSQAPSINSQKCHSEDGWGRTRQAGPCHLRKNLRSSP